MNDLYDYTKYSKEQTITYILLILGLIILFFNNLLGGLILGMVAGYYFAPEIVNYIRHSGEMLAGQNQLRYVILITILLGFLISAPGIFIGAAIVTLFKQALTGGRHDSNDENRK